MWTTLIEAARAHARAALIVLLGLGWLPPAAAQTYPSKPIKIVVPFPAGGISDVYSRLVGSNLSEAWGQPVVVENRTGAGGNIGTDLVAKAPPDGYTLVMGSVGTHAVNVTLFSKLPYDPVRDFAPVALVLEADGLLVVHPSVPALSVPELIALARAKPNGLTFASAGMGTASHLAGELFKTMAKVEIVHVPYKGNVPAITDLLAGQTSMLFATMPTVLPHAKAGKLRALATIGRSRAAATPEIPTVAETLPGFEVGNWVALFAPAGTPPEIVQRWNAEVVRIMQGQEIQARLANEGASFRPMTPDEFGAFVRAEIAKWAPVVKASGARAD
ncbi:MAG TPA: tripartite tricarboxylate transporter substrate binding protein [Burkholderiales bacterium]|nr:tripartite tricarboxylate transporter substrate binding protein [Burkholderiales bacterium]